MASKELPPAAQGKTNKTPEFESQRLDFEAKIRVEFSINATKQGELDKIDEALKSRVSAFDHYKLFNPFSHHLKFSF